MRSGLNKWKIAASGIVLSFVMAGCVKEEFSSRKLDTSVYLAPALAVPVGYFDLRLIDMLNISENTTLYINSDSIVSLNYSGEVDSDKAGELFRFEPVSEEYSLSVPGGETIDLSLASYELSVESHLSLFMSNSGVKAELDSIVPLMARISVSSIQFGNAYAELEIIIPGLKQGNQSFRTLITPNSGDILIDVSNYHLELLNLPGQKNLIDVRINVFYPEQAVMLNASDPLAQFRFELFLDEWEIIYGYIGQETIELPPASFSTNFSRDFPEGEFYFADPLLKFKTINSFGVPLGMSFSPITAETLLAGMIELKGPGVPVPPDY
ncbi:MAG: hypothetical protein IH594_12255, partial [Bacteroidales bacterium]|nr:hypothetical protein [Bacteroidales bacterium]